MKIEKIKEILMLGEDRNIEFKSQYNDIENIGPIICGFLNSFGGYIICGIGENGEITGFDGSDLNIQNFEKSLAQEISPPATVFVQRQSFEGQFLLIIEVPPGQDQPYAFRNDIYVRSGSNTQKADVKIIRELIQRKQTGPERWERRYSSADLDNDLDSNEIRATLKDIVKKGRTTLFSNVDSISFLETLSVANYGHLTNAGDVLFGSDPSSRNPQIRVRASIFTKDKTTLEYQNTKSFQGPLGVLLEYAYSFILNYTPTMSRFKTGDLKRVDKSLYPSDAIREGLINAFAHRDYSDFSGGITIQIYSDRLEIWNSAKFPEGKTLEKILSERKSVLINPDIAHILYLRGFMEKMGRGSDLIRNACLKHNLPPPQWSGNDLGVTLTF
ncbi:MAG: RNA-binding domain-containing protein, partial [Methanoregula sp.]